MGFGKEQTINDDKWSKNFDERPHRRGAPSPENAATSAGILAPFMVPHPSPHPKRHHDRFIRFSTAHGYAQQTGTHTHTHTQRPLNIITIDRIFAALRACEAS